MTDHEHYEMLCALAATGQLDALEETEFEAHRLDCAECCDRLEELVCLGAALQLREALRAMPTKMPQGAVERFQARALHEGITTHAVPERGFAFHARVPAAALFVVVLTLGFVLQGRRVIERNFASEGVSMADRPSVVANEDQRPVLQRPARVIRTRLPRHRRPGVSKAQDKETSATVQRFPQLIAASYLYFSPQVETKMPEPQYPALSGPQISRLDPFRPLRETAARDGFDAAAYGRPMDIASTGKVFDFAAEIHQLHFQLPTVQ
jgi:hypothetical protein